VLAGEADAIASVADLRPRLAGLRVPVLARVGDADTAVPVALSAEVASLVPGGRLEIVPGAAHVLAIEDLPGTVDSIEQTLRR